MKFYRDKKYNNYHFIIVNYNLTAIYCNKSSCAHFFKNGNYHNTKNASFHNYYGYKEFRLNNKLYATDKDFIKETWRRFVKMQAFL